jgi:hypothetical protein
MARKNSNLHAAKVAKNDEFYTQLDDIANEMVYYRPHFEGKKVLCNCNDALHTGFAKFFSLQFEILGLKELICTSFAMEEGGHGVVYRYKGDKNGNNVPDIEEWEQTPMEGNGGFNTPEGLALIDEADIIVTNPPFSLFREFIGILMEHNKKFLIIGNMNAIIDKIVFPLLKENKIWLGTQHIKEFVSDSGETKKFGNILWYTNLDHKKRHEEIILYKKYNEAEYPKYDNYDAIEVSKVADIPFDYEGIMGVPITFLDKYCPDQFEIIGIAEGDSGKELGLKPFPPELKKLNPSLRQGQLYYMEDGYPVKPYARILIRKKQSV